MNTQEEHHVKEVAGNRLLQATTPMTARQTQRKAALGTLQEQHHYLLALGSLASRTDSEATNS